jgi:histidinol dehydrogenase
MKWMICNKNSIINKRTWDENQEAEQRVREIITDVREHGDQTVKKLTEQFDGAVLEDLSVTKQMIEQAYESVSEPFVSSIRQAAENIRLFHEKKRTESWEDTFPDGVVLGQKVTPLDSTGLYIPGGTAAYPSTVLMAAIPAQTAGVERIVIVSPPQNNGVISSGVLVAANEIGIQEIYQAGGAQAIAMLAYGTETVKPVDKIVGPGNLYVTLAKKAVYGDVDIDSLAGPSEIAILADDSARAGWIAADLLSQAEHDPLSMAILITPSKELGEAVEKELQLQLENLPRRAIAEKALEAFGKIILVDSLESGVEAVNQLAPEHLEIVVENDDKVLDNIRHAGAIFIGPYSSEPVGDYFAGPNHIIPTNGTARFSSPLSVDSFLKKSSVIRYSREALHNNSQAITELARYEGLEAHARAIEKRTQEE